MNPIENKRVAAIYDIHGNLPALEAVLREIRRGLSSGLTWRVCLRASKTLTYSYCTNSNILCGSYAHVFRSAVQL